jgi:hypothetical protein
MGDVTIYHRPTRDTSHSNSMGSLEMDVLPATRKRLRLYDGNTLNTFTSDMSTLWAVIRCSCVSFCFLLQYWKTFDICKIYPTFSSSPGLPPVFFTKYLRVHKASTMISRMKISGCASRLAVRQLSPVGQPLFPHVSCPIPNGGCCCHSSGI